MREGAALRPKVLIKGTVADRPWGATLAAIGLSGRSGQLTLVANDGKLHRLAFANGLIVGASSPNAADSIARVALAAKLVSPPQARALRRVEDIDRFGEVVQLSPRQVQQLKRRVIVQRAARTFEIDLGRYTVEDRVAIPTVLGIEIDVRAAIYHGMRLNLSQQRLTRTLARFGASRFTFRPEAVGDLARYEFADDEQPVLEALRTGTSVPELEAAHRELDPRLVESVVCTLALCDAIMPCDAQDLSIARAPTPREPTMTRVPTPREPTVSSCVPMLIRRDPTVVITTNPPKPPRPPPLPRLHTRRSATDPFLEAQLTKQRPPSLSKDEVLRLIAIGTELLALGVDHFTFLGIPIGASIDDVRDAYVEFARYLRPERLVELGIRDPTHEARTVFAQVVIAYTVLTDPARRAAYLTGLRATSP